MNHDAMNNSDQTSSHRPSNNRPFGSGEKQEGDSRKPFVNPELRRETDLLDGTGTTVSWSGG
jgi:hypothetical protein